MRLLLDTHTFLWWAADDPRLSYVAEAAIAASGNPVFISAATTWEITTKCRVGKLPGAAILAANVAAQIAVEGLLELPITVPHAQQAGALQGRHKDPFDRILIAQALVEGLSPVSNERLFDAYGVTRVW